MQGTNRSGEWGGGKEAFYTYHMTPGLSYAQEAREKKGEDNKWDRKKKKKQEKEKAASSCRLGCCLSCTER